MTFRIWDCEFSFLLDTTTWNTEDRPHVWDFTFRVLWLSPAEKAHRAWVKELKRTGQL